MTVRTQNETLCVNRHSSHTPESQYAMPAVAAKMTTATKATFAHSSRFMAMRSPSVLGGRSTPPSPPNRNLVAGIGVGD